MWAQEEGKRWVRKITEQKEESSLKYSEFFLIFQVQRL